MRSNAAAARAVSAASQLRDLARPVKDLISLAVAVAGPLAAPEDRLAASEMRDDRDAEPADVTGRESSAYAVDGDASVKPPAGPLLNSQPMHPLLPDMQAPAGLEEDSGHPFRSPTLPIPSSIFTAEQVAPPKNAARNGNLRAEPSASDFPATSSTSSLEAKIEKKSPPTSLLPQPYLNGSTAAQTLPRPAQNDPLAAMLALSEEELIALFS